jgi:hypothetical protein
MNRLRDISKRLKLVDPVRTWYKSRWGGWKFLLNRKKDAIRERDGVLSYVWSYENQVDSIVNFHYHIDAQGQIEDMRLCVATAESIFAPHPNVTFMHDIEVWDWHDMIIPEDIK